MSLSFAMPKSVISGSVLSWSEAHQLQTERERSEYYLQWGPFEPMPVPGFVNTGLPAPGSCDTLRHNSTVGVQKGFLHDGLIDIATALDSRPVVDYPDDLVHDPKLTPEDIIGKTWTRMLGSSVWLPNQNVYLSVTRVSFCPSQIWALPKVSFLRGQLFNEGWEHLDNHTLIWGDKMLTFPTIFDIAVQWEAHGSLYGPEDPRLVLEEDVEGAEPVVVFNMVAERSDWKRAMYIFRPFTNYTKILTIGDEERQHIEKNWAPFFVPEEEDLSSDKRAWRRSRVVRRPSDYIHFVYAFKPLRILKCHLRCGDCEVVFEQTLPETVTSHHREDGGSLCACSHAAAYGAAPERPCIYGIPTDQYPRSLRWELLPAGACRLGERWDTILPCVRQRVPGFWRFDPGTRTPG